MSSIGFETVYGDEGGRRTPYMTRVWFGRLRLHVFHRGDADPDCHDHPWDFWTFPLTSYVEEVVAPTAYEAKGLALVPSAYKVVRRVVPAWRPHFRPATHAHRVLGRAVSKTWIEIVGHPFAEGLDHRPFSNVSDATTWTVVPGKIVTIVWRSDKKRSWGFFKNRDGRWCWIGWRDYVDGGGKDAPCSDDRDAITEARHG